MFSLSQMVGKVELPMATAQKKEVYDRYLHPRDKLHEFACSGLSHIDDLIRIRLRVMDKIQSCSFQKLLSLNHNVLCFGFHHQKDLLYVLLLTRSDRKDPLIVHIYLPKTYLLLGKR
jgi:hypothetical protein